MKIDDMDIDVQRLIALLLKQPWHKRCEIIPDYMPPYPKPSTKPKVVIHCGESFLRYSKGPAQGFFWDCYGDNFQSIELAIIALSRAPYPGG